ncbi:hypothetical protein EYC80_006084 [Monilinia laxa]|uniref:Uncharacterized protein n=1 Tax=Monilinia laxa TaxID=61186 RepID=A0A5N6KGM4_MONLA|nr:hypothetical protein EYC80_006084 [Monilinia laxa]
MPAFHQAGPRAQPRFNPRLINLHYRADIASKQDADQTPRQPLGRYLSHLQIQSLPQPLPAIPHQPRMLPQDVFHLRRPHLYIGACALSRPPLWTYIAQKGIQSGVLCGSRH